MEPDQLQLNRNQLKLIIILIINKKIINSLYIIKDVNPVIRRSLSFIAIQRTSLQCSVQPKPLFWFRFDTDTKTQIGRYFGRIPKPTTSFDLKCQTLPMYQNDIFDKSMK